MKKSRTALISSHKLKRFTEDVMKNKAWVPGPGQYNIGPPKTNWRLAFVQALKKANN